MASDLQFNLAYLRADDLDERLAPVPGLSPFGLGVYIPLCKVPISSSRLDVLVRNLKKVEFSPFALKAEEVHVDEQDIAYATLASGSFGGMKQLHQLHNRIARVAHDITDFGTQFAGISKRSCFKHYEPRMILGETEKGFVPMVAENAIRSHSVVFVSFYLSSFPPPYGSVKNWDFRQIAEFDCKQ